MFLFPSMCENKFSDICVSSGGLGKYMDYVLSVEKLQISGVGESNLTLSLYPEI